MIYRYGKEIYRLAEGIPKSQVADACCINMDTKDGRRASRKCVPTQSMGTRINNAGMNNRHIKKFCPVDAESGVLLERAMDKFGLSARAHVRILKIARTIADLEGSSEMRAAHVGEAIQYRTLDRKMVR